MGVKGIQAVGMMMMMMMMMIKVYTNKKFNDFIKKINTMNFFFFWIIKKKNFILSFCQFQWKKKT